ncbi:hypothetical protein Pcinc_023382 [Petrolisthes cinctipes]|uniref:Uncharacterized protein n=1 Tax=Petrolisthes cinctipes TaxID=88211 RepID=A0AAE1FDR2_PETCI|nr:hypothetical protein Pcinc_023382 [Petrolisthes cinctipes]
MSSSVPDLKYRGRRASLQSAWDSTNMGEAVTVNQGTGGMGHSPLKVRHSVDLGVERNRLLHTEDGQTALNQQPWEQLSGPAPLQSRLHPMYSTTIVEWLEWAGVLDDRGDHQARRELGEKGGEHAVKKHNVTVNTSHAVPIFLNELRKWMNQHCADTTTHVFVEERTEHTDTTHSPDYLLIDPTKVLERDVKGGYVDKNYVIVGRNYQQWWATLYEDNYNDYYLNAITSSKNSQRYHPLVVSPRGRCVSGGTDTNFNNRPDPPTYTCPDTVHTHPDPTRTDSTHTRPGSASVSTAGVGVGVSGVVVGTLGMSIPSTSPATIPMSSPVTVPSTPTSLTSVSRAGGASSIWGLEMPEMVFVPRQKLLLATLQGLELTVYTYNWTKDQCDSLHSAITRLAQWSTARSRLLATLVLQKMGLYHNQPFVRKPIHKVEDNNPYLGNHNYTDSLVKLQAPPRESSVTSDRPNRRPQGGSGILNLTDLRESQPPVRSRLNLQYSHLKDLELRHGTQMADIRRHVIYKETQRKVLLKTVVETRGNSSPAFTDKILSLYKQHARLVHFCYTPLLFLPRWRWQVAAARDHSLVFHPTHPSSSPTDKAAPTKVPEPRSRHDSGSSMKGLVVGGGGGGVGIGLTSSSSGSDLRRSLSLRSTSSTSAIITSSATPAVPSPGQQRRRHITGGGDEKWHDALCSHYLKEYIQYLQSLGFLTLNVTQVSHQKGRSGPWRESENQGFRGKEVRFSEQATKQPTYLLKNVLGGTILLQIEFLQPYFFAKIYVLESCRLEGKRLSSQFAINSFLDKVDDIKVLLHMHSFTYDFHLRAVCEYVANRQLLFAPGYHLSSCLSDFIKYYNKGPNFARNLIYSGSLTIEDTGTPGEQLYNYLLAREKHYRMRVLRMTPVMIDPNAEMHYTEFILVHTKTCQVHYRDGNDQRVSDEYDVTLLVSHDTSPNTSPDARLEEPIPNILHLNFYVILTSRREMYPNRILEKKMGRFRTVSVLFAPTLNKRWTPSSTRTGSRDHSGSDISMVTVDESTNNTTASDLPKLSSEETTENSSSSDATVNTSQTSTNDQNNQPTSKSYSGIRSESVDYLGYYTLYEETMQRTLHTQAEEARKRIHHIFNQAKIHCRRDSLWQRLTAGLRDEDKQKLPREQVVGGLSFSEISELLDLVSVEPLSSVDPQLLPLLSKPLHWYQAFTRVLQAKYQERHRSLTSSDGNIQHVVILSPSCPDAFMMLSINLHYQKAELCCVNKQLKGEGTTQQAFTDRRVQILVEDFVNACCFHLWSGLL